MADLGPPQRYSETKNTDVVLHQDSDEGRTKKSTLPPNNTMCKEEHVKKQNKTKKTKKQRKKESLFLKERLTPQFRSVPTKGFRNDSRHI